MSPNTSRPNSLAELMMRSPAPIIRSNTPWWNRTSLIASSGISIERFAIHPSRWMTRSDVTTKYDVTHATNLRTGNQIRTKIAIAVAPQNVTSRPVPSSGPYDTAAIQPAITRIVTIAGITRAIQCGRSSRTSCSFSIRSLRGNGMGGILLQVLDLSEPHDLVARRRSDDQSAELVDVHGLALDDRSGGGRPHPRSERHAHVPVGRDHAPGEGRGGGLVPADERGE